MCDSYTISGMEKMHETTARLFEAVESLYPGEAITSAVARRMNVGDNSVTNWKERGMSFKGAVMAEAAFGVPAAWIMFGIRPPIPNTWPFSDRIDFSRISSLPREDLAFLAGKLDSALQAIEALGQDSAPSQAAKA